MLQFVTAHLRINPDTGQWLARILGRDPDTVQTLTGQGGSEFGRHDFLLLETPVASAWPDRFRRRKRCHQGFG